MNFRKIKQLIISHKYVSISVLAAVILICVFLAFKIYEKNKNANNNYFITESGQKIPKKIDNPDLDSDADGLRDWEEPLYGTDQYNPDTDNDGYLDGEEIMSGYDPTRPAPNDKKSEYAMDPRLNPQTLTENLTEHLFFAILEKRVDPKDAEKILFSPDIEQSQTYAAVGDAFEKLKTANQKLYNLPEIPDEMITIIKDSSGSALNDYNKQTKKIVEIILEKNLSLERITEAFGQAIETKDFSTTNKIKESYKDLYNILIVTPVPSNLVEDHKTTLQIFSGMIQIFSDIENIQNDPVKAAIATERFRNVAYSLFRTYEDQTGQKIINEEE